MVPRQPRSLVQRIREQIGFSLVAVLILFIVLRALGLRATVSALFVSVLLTIALNVGLSYWYEFRARRENQRGGTGRGQGGARMSADGDIRWREHRPSREELRPEREERRGERR